MITIVKIGMNLLLWTDNPKFSTDHLLIEKIKDYGFDGVEFPISSMEIENARSFSALCNELDLGRTALVLLDAGKADPSSSEPLLRGRALDQIKHAVDVTKELGSDLLSGPLFQGLGKLTGAGPTEDEWKWSVEVIRKASEYAESAGVKIALEPLNRFEMYMVNTISDGVRFVEDVQMDNVGLLVDTHHANIEENHIADSLTKYAKHIFHIHTSENHRGIPGSGHAMPREFFEAIHKINYQNWLTIEAFSHLVPDLIPLIMLWRKWSENEEQIAQQGLAFVKENLMK